MENLPKDIHQVVVQGHTFSVDKRYKLDKAKILGRGSFGVVTTAVDSETGDIIAIKRIRPYCNDEWDARHTLREVRLMKLLGDHPNVISLHSLSLFEEKAELYMMMELMDCDLHRIIQSKQPLSDAHFKCFAKQMLEGIKAMHSVGVFHRDLKPGNILVSKDCQLRITDFGLARYMDTVTLAGENQENPMTEYVVTRWYRCPELLLAPTRPYSAGIDMWSIGLILAELLRRKPLFPGKSHAHQVQLIFELKGYTGDKLGFPISSEALAFLDRRCRGPARPLSGMLPGAPSQALSLLDSLMQMDPNKRPTASAVLKIPYLQDATTTCDYSNVDHCVQKPNPQYFDFENTKFSVDALKQKITEEVFNNHAVSSRIGLENIVAAKLGVHRVSVDNTPRTAVPSNASSAAPSRPSSAQSQSSEPETDTSIHERFSEKGDPPALDRPCSQLPTQQRGARSLANNISYGQSHAEETTLSSDKGTTKSDDSKFSKTAGLIPGFNSMKLENAAKLLPIKPALVRGKSTDSGEMTKGRGGSSNDQLKAGASTSTLMSRFQSRYTSISSRVSSASGPNKLPSLSR